MNRQDVKEYIKEWTTIHQDEFTAIAKELHRNPELGLCEFESSKLLEDILEKHGFTVERGVAELPTAFIATYGSEGNVVGFNAEYDALPGMSQKPGVDHKEPVTEGAPGHACGHNLLGTAGCMGAIALRYAMEEKGMKGIIKVFGSPAEEICIGKPYMAKAGCYNGVDFFVDWHPNVYNAVFEDYCSAFFNVKYHFKGKACHGNKPWYGRSALDGAILTTHAIEMLREHVAPNCDEAANTINYTFSNVGPGIANVVPEDASLWVVGRFRTIEQLKDAMDRIDACAEGCAKAAGVTVRKEFITATHDKIPTATLSKVMYDNLKEEGPISLTEAEKARISRMEESMGYEKVGLSMDIEEFKEAGTILCDTSEFSWFAPYTTVWLSLAPAEGGWHNWMIASNDGSDIGFKTMQKAARIMAYTACDAIEDDALIADAKKELKERLAGQTYETLIPDGVKPPYGINAGIMKQYRVK